MNGRSVEGHRDMAGPYWSDQNTPVRYARYTFTVDASLNGKSTGPHKAISLFGTDPQEKEFVAENDLINATYAGMWQLLKARPIRQDSC